jgi:hypothetical protein
MMRILGLFVRSVVWTTLAAAVITSLIVWRTPPEIPMTRHIVVTWFGIMWSLCFVPSLASELLMARLRLELGDVNDRKT